MTQRATTVEEWGLRRLPPELRLRVWESTWPRTRLIEVRLPSGSGNAPRRIKPSRQVGAEKVTVWNSERQVLEDVACLPYAHPIALQVCREARNHTLKTYQRLQHLHVADCGFYFDPRRDVLWLHRDLSQFTLASLGQVQRVLFKDVERFDDSDADKKQRRRELLEMVESMGNVREVMVLAHWTSISDLDGTKSSETLYDWMQYFVSILDENWEIMDGHPWVLQFLSTWGELGVCFDGGDARIWGTPEKGHCIHAQVMMWCISRKIMANRPPPAPTSGDDGKYYDLGSYHRPVTTSSSEAQTWFDRGLIWSYAFNHEEAIACFEKAIALDASFPMAYWGLAYALGPNYNKPWESFEGRELESTVEKTHRAARQAAQLSHLASPVEVSILDALRFRYPVGRLSDGQTDGEGASSPDWSVWNKAYAAAMGEAYRSHPNDLDVAALYVDALMNLTPWQLWNLSTGEPATGARTLEAKQILETALTQPGGDKHPGLLHLWIHLMEMSSRPEDALPLADNLRELVPDAGHLNHMPSHLDVLCGHYANAVKANTAAINADEKYASRAGKMNFYTLYRSHDYHFRIYAAMFSGQSKIAIDTAIQLEESIPEDLLRVETPPMADWLEGFLSMRFHAYVRFGRWNDILALPFPADQDLYCATTASLHYARSLALASLNRAEEADKERTHFHAALARVPHSRTVFNNTCVDVLAVAGAMLDGEVEYRHGNYDVAFAHLRRSTELYDNLPYDEPWGFMQPTRHALAALLLEQGHVEESCALYKADLGLDETLPRTHRHLGNVWALHGYHECLVKLGRDKEAAEIAPQLKAALEIADVPIKASCYCRLKL